jgi:drug/metabolite transporter (DMT)-like permease
MAMNRSDRVWEGMLWVTLSTVLFSVMNVLVRLAAAHHVPWAEVGAARSFVGVFVTIGAAWLQRAPLAVRDQRRAWARSLAGTTAMVCFFFTLGAPAIALGDAATLASTGPIFIALLAPKLLGEPTGRGVFGTTLVAFAGAALIAGPRFHITGHLAVIATLGAFFSALAMISLRRLGGRSKDAPPESPEAIALHFSVVACVIMTAIAIPTFRIPNTSGLLFCAATGLVAGLGQLALTRAYSSTEPAKLGSISYLGVVLSQLFGAGFLGEHPDATQVAGGALVIGAGLLHAWSMARDVGINGPSPDAS